MRAIHAGAMNPHWITFGAAVVTMAAALAGWYLVRGSTAVPATMWAAAAALALAYEAAVTATGGLQGQAAESCARLVVVAFGVGPAMSVLGAKRPQHGVWQFIVAALVGVLSMPAVTAVLVRPGSMPDLHLLEQLFLPLLVAIGFLNFIATTRFASAIMVAGGQVVLMWSFLPIVGDGQRLPTTVEAIGAWVMAAGAILAALQAMWWPASAWVARGASGAIDRPLIALRETLGAAWTLRVIERFNAVAVERGWPCRLRFAGLVLTQDARDGRWEADAIRCVRSLLRRFASAAWIERHSGQSPIRSLLADKTVD